LHYVSPIEQRKQKRPQGHCDYSLSVGGPQSTNHERKQKRPQGHCDFGYHQTFSALFNHPRENKNARKGIATNMETPPSVAASTCERKQKRLQGHCRRRPLAADG